MTDPRPLLLRAAEQIGAFATADTPLDDPTPCAGWTTGDLLAHLVAVHRRIAHVGRGGDPFDLPHRIVVDDHVAALAEGRREIDAVWADDGVLDRTLTVPWGEVPGRVAAWGYVQELTVHAWDLAAARGATADLDPAPATALADLVPTMVPEQPRGGRVPFGPVVPVAATAGPYERLVGWLGRDPATVRA